MGRARRSRQYNIELTENLDIEELEAIEGDSYNIVAMNADREMPCCIRCEGEVRNHGRFEKEYTDIIKKDDGTLKFISLHYVFYKYRCTNCDCHTLFQKPIYFARENANVTKRFEDYVVHLAMYLSYSKVENIIKSAVSKQAVGQIIKRWTAAKDEERGNFFTPKTLGLVSCKSDKDYYIVVIDATDKDLCVMEVLPSKSSDLIISLLNHMDNSEINFVITDCDPMIVDTVRDRLPGAELLVDTAALLEVVVSNFNQIINEDASHVYNVDKDRLKKNPAILKEGDGSRIRDITNTKPRVSSAYDHVNNLRSILSREWDIDEIWAWKEQIPIDCKQEFELTSAYIEAYWQEFMNFYKRRTVVTDELYEKLMLLNEKIQKNFTSYSDEILRSRILYSSHTNKKTEDGEIKWRGIPIDIVLKTIDTLIQEMEGQKNEY